MPNVLKKLEEDYTGFMLWRTLQSSANQGKKQDRAGPFFQKKNFNRCEIAQKKKRARGHRMLNRNEVFLGGGKNSRRHDM